MADEKDRFGEKMRLVEKAREDIYFAEKDRELIDKLKAQLQRVERPGAQLGCPKCPGKLETFTFMDIILDRCAACGGLWLDKGELEGIMRQVSRSRLTSMIDRFLDRRQREGQEGPK